MRILTFETEKAKQDIWARGMSKWEAGNVKPEEEILGKKFINKITDGYISKASIRHISDEVGFGLFTEEDLDQEVYVGEYTGLVRRNNRRYLEPLNNYCYEYPVQDEIGRHFVIDATNGNLTRFINHSYHPNLKPTYAFYDGFYHLIFLTVSPIKKGSQLFYDYGLNYWYLRMPPQEISG